VSSGSGAIERGRQPLDGDRFRQMVRESNAQAPRYISRGIVTAHGDSANRALKSKLLQQPPPVSIRQREIAQQHIKFHMVREIEAGRDVASDEDLMARSLEELFQDVGILSRIFNHQNAKGVFGHRGKVVRL
jgi:hypothetical protein